MTDTADVVVIGSGPNSLVAAILLARRGWSVTVLEQSAQPGGAVQSDEMTIPGFIHDPSSAFYGLLHASPVFTELGLDTGVEWAHFDTPMGAAVSPDIAAVIDRDHETTAARLGPDRDAYRELVAWWDRVGSRFLDMMLRPIGAIRPALRLARRSRIRGSIDLATMLATPLADLMGGRFEGAAARTLVASGITHTDLSVEDTFGAPASLILAMVAQTKGMPVPVGGAGRLTDALVGLLERSGGSLRCDAAAVRIVVEKGRAIGVETADGSFIRARRAVLAGTGPVALAKDLVGEEHLPRRYLAGIRRFRYGGGMFKVDLALDQPLQWRNASLDRCGVVHLTGSLDDLAQSAAETRRGVLASTPALIIGQQCVADPSRAPQGGATLWVETHVPPTPRADAASSHQVSGWSDAKEPFLERVLERIEHHAPGFRDSIRGLVARTPTDLHRENPNLVDGDVGGGSSRADMQAIFRPVPGWFRYATPIDHLYLCSASTHPGGGVHGMCGMNAARRVLRDHRIPWR